MKYPIAFPVTPEAFISHQERAIGRKLDKWETKFSVELTQLANLAFDKGQNGRELLNIFDAAEETFVSRGLSDNLKLPSVQDILKKMDAWIRIAYQAGKEKAQRDQLGMKLAGELQGEELEP